MKKRWLFMMREKFQYNNETYTVIDVLSIKNMDFAIYQDSTGRYRYLKRNEIEGRMTYSSFETLVKILPQYQSIGHQNIKNMLDAYVRVLTQKEDMVSLKNMFWEVLERDQEYLETTTNQILSVEYFETLFQTGIYSYYGKNANRIYHLDSKELKEQDIPLEEKKTIFTIPNFFYAVLVLFLLISFSGFLGTFTPKQENKKLSDYLLLNTNFIARLEKEPKEIKVDEKNYWDDIHISIMNVDFKELKKENSNIIGTLFLNNTSISYPILQENEDDNKNIGWLYATKNSDFVNFKNNTFLYTTSDFGKFIIGNESLLEASWYEKAENRLFVISTPVQNTVWQIEAVSIKKKNKEVLQILYQNPIFNNLKEEEKTVTIVIPLDSKNKNIVIEAKLLQSKKANS